MVAPPVTGLADILACARIAARHSFTWDVLMTNGGHFVNANGCPERVARHVTLSRGTKEVWTFFAEYRGPHGGIQFIGHPRQFRSAAELDALFAQIGLTSIPPYRPKTVQLAEPVGAGDQFGPDFPRPAA